MHIIKYILLGGIFSICTYIGMTLSKRTSNRVKELKEMKTALNMFETKIKYTYETIPEVFMQISDKVEKNISNIFSKASNYMQDMSAGDAWEKSLDTNISNMTKEDIEVLKGLSKLLGKTNLEGQVSEIEVISQFLETQIKNAQIQNDKNSKMYKTLGMTVGLAFVIILI